MEMIASKIKIRKAKPWAIYFDYEDKKILIARKFRLLRKFYYTI